ncbi:NTP transferase domain-containing protein, partial [Beggiatoa alba]|nr:NTP transferase domain-containing protein [Beggiatoa alba]
MNTAVKKWDANNATKVNGLILAGGRGKRMGGEDKGLILFESKCLIEHCITKLQPQVNEIFISANRNIEQYRQYGFTVLQDSLDGFQGPLAGI